MHPDFDHSQHPLRRATDITPPPPPQCPCSKEVLEAMQRMQEDLRDIKHGMGTIRTAFVRNDLGQPDYEGHRQAHLGMIKKTQEIDQIKTAGTLKVVGIVVGAVVLVFMSGLSAHLQKLVGG
jgi:hypothetical protein